MLANTDEASKCIKSCDVGWFSMSIMEINVGRVKKCSKCSFPCLDCYEPYMVNCINCKTGYQLVGSKCMFKVCKESEWLNINSGNCEKCHESCKSCISNSNTGCLNCKNEFKEIWIGDAKYCRACSDIHAHFVFNKERNDCAEIYGDGFYSGSYECDDGNTNNGDGCSSACKLEKGWVCKKTNEYGIHCVNVAPIQVRRFKVMKDLSFVTAVSKLVKTNHFEGNFDIVVRKFHSIDVVQATNVTLLPYHNYSKTMKGYFNISQPIQIGDVIGISPKKK